MQGVNLGKDKSDSSLNQILMITLLQHEKDKDVGKDWGRPALHREVLHGIVQKMINKGQIEDLEV